MLNQKHSMSHCLFKWHLLIPAALDDRVVSCRNAWRNTDILNNETVQNQPMEKQSIGLARLLTEVQVWCCLHEFEDSLLTLYIVHSLIPNKVIAVCCDGLVARGRPGNPPPSPADTRCAWARWIPLSPWRLCVSPMQDQFCQQAAAAAGSLWFLPACRRQRSEELPSLRCLLLCRPPEAPVHGRRLQPSRPAQRGEEPGGLGMRSAQQEAEQVLLERLDLHLFHVWEGRTRRPSCHLHQQGSSQEEGTDLKRLCKSHYSTTQYTLGVMSQREQVGLH